MTGGRAVSCVQDVLAPLETVQLPHGGDLILAVAAGDAVAEFGMYPQAVLVFGLLPVGRGVGQHHRRRGRLAAQLFRDGLF